MTYKHIAPRIEHDTIVVIGTVRIGSLNAQKILAELKDAIVVQYSDNEGDTAENIQSRTNPYGNAL